MSAIASSSQCITVTIEEDNALEGMEDFFVVIIPDLSGASSEVVQGVTVTPDTLIVKITDNDGNDECYRYIVWICIYIAWGISLCPL